MRQCPTCGSRFEAPAQYCQRDGAHLRIEQESSDPYIGTRILGQLRLERSIGAGGMGVVYSAFDEGLSRRVAVKILHKDLLANRDVAQRFHREAQIAHQLDHPHIVRLILFGQLPDGNMYLVLEYLEGPTLAALLERDGPLAPERAVKIMSAIADAIGYAHRRDIVHRDLKPENVMLVSRDGDPEHPKVLDFGIAKMLVGGDTLVTQAGLIFGTARYISPEGAQGEPVDKRSDVYSLAVMAYQTLCGRTPFDAAEPVQLLLKHIHEPAPALLKQPRASAVPPALADVVMRGLAKNPEARYSDGAAFARALREALAASDPHNAIRSVIPTQGMPAFASPAAPVAARAEAHPRATLVAGSPALAAPLPGNAYAGHGAAPLAMPAVPLHAFAAAPSPVAHAPGVESGRFPAALPAHGASPYEPATAQLAHGAAIHPVDDDDEIIIPGLTPRRRNKSRKPSAELTAPVPRSNEGARSDRTALVVALTVALTALAGAGASWALGLFPAQRRETEVSALLARANDALTAGRLVHERAGNANDVEDLTDGALALAPDSALAKRIRAAAAMRLRNQAVEQRNNGNPSAALPLLEQARRLADDDTELNALISTIEREAHASAVAPTAPTAPAAPAAPPGHLHAAPRPHPTAASVNPGPPLDLPGPENPARPIVPSGGPTFTPGSDPTVPLPPRAAPRPPAARTPPPAAPPSVVIEQPPAVFPQPAEPAPQPGPPPPAGDPGTAF